MIISTNVIIASLENYSPTLHGDHATISYSILSKLILMAENDVHTKFINDSHYAPMSESAHPIYVSNYFNQIHTAPQKMAALICIDTDYESHKDIYNEIKVPVIILNTDSALDEVYEWLLHCIFATHQDDDLKFDILTALEKNKDLYHILKLCTKYLGVPFSVINTSYRIIAETVSYSWPKNRPMPNFFKESFKNKYVANEIIDEFVTNGKMSKVRNTFRPVHMLYKDGTEKLSIAIQVHGAYVGMISMYAVNRPFIWRDFEILPYLSKIASIYLQKTNSLSYDKENELASLIRDFIKYTPSEPVIDSRIKRLDINFSDKLVAVNIMSNTKDKSKFPIKLVQQQLHNIFPFSYSVVINGTILNIIDLKNIYQADEKIISKLSEFLKRKNLIAGVSNTFSSIKDIKTYYNQCNFSIERGLKSSDHKHLFEYNDYLIEHLLSVASENLPVESFIYPSITMLQDYDKTHDTPYLATLRAYIKSNGHLANCSQLLNVHYNTIKYRLSKIESLTNMDLRDKKTFFDLELAFKIYDYKES